jgi:hypothetical protein
VIATTSDANNDTMNAIPRGASNLPSIPDKKNSGMKAAMIMNVAFITDDLISTEAL